MSQLKTLTSVLMHQAQGLKEEISILDRRLVEWHRSDEACDRLDAIPGVGPALAAVLVASVADPTAFRSGPDFLTWIGLLPKQNSSGGREKARQYHQGADRYLRSLSCTGALALIVTGSRPQPHTTRCEQGNHRTARSDHSDQPRLIDIAGASAQDAPDRSRPDWSEPLDLIHE